MDAEIKYYRKDYGGALTALGEITKRAYGNAAYYTDPSDAAVKRAIVEESLKELVGEGRTWWTLIRLDAVWDYNKDVADQARKQRQHSPVAHHAGVHHQEFQAQTDGGLVLIHNPKNERQ